nr:DUF6512 family protein [uncultured Anaerostipes sp.]
MKQFKYYIILGIIFVLIMGTLSHFLYQWMNQNTLIGLFCPVNESVWEHMKLVFFPMLFYSVFLYCIFSEKLPCVTSSLPLAILYGTILIPVLFYTYTGILGKDFMILDLAIFAVSVFGGFYILSSRSRLYKYSCFARFLWILVFLFVIGFFIFAYFPPPLPLFESP